MSSFELLELFGVSIVDDPEARIRTIQVDFAPEDGAVSAAMRDGDRPEWKQMLAQAANESAVLRAGMLPGSDATAYGSRLFFPVSRIREMEAEQQAVLAEERRLRDEGLDDDGLYSLWNE
jgi:hypothetical protein